ncbi:thiosulfate oxidation carrier complex protein SoxZ [Paracoccus zhejiangensis]|uniref:Thiosulfate oxidation carrier complex protein SoxZ n=1 Tax=Paracoccus zhejiangensis TaxID=1077935 RepID=A0A2H5F306_9RHOB|nr:thiosulfate oxidation carrier complex protein SoxZ [Paracoccus zhejiangensis]AUH65907.1 thiosulfate oxidation carrier complex protein SoxZ [Paracoccus zhejiangensis]
MASNVTPRLRLPKTAAKGEVIEIRTLISHPMESGLRKDAQGRTIPRGIINRLVVTFNDQPVIDVDLGPGISANPYFAFHAMVPGAGEFLFSWFDDDGSVYEERRQIEVT